MAIPDCNGDDVFTLNARLPGNFEDSGLNLCHGKLNLTAFAVNDEDLNDLADDLAGLVQLVAHADDEPKDRDICCCSFWSKNELLCHNMFQF